MSDREYECEGCGSDNAYRRGGECNACMRRLDTFVDLASDDGPAHVECHDCGRCHPSDATVVAFIGNPHVDARYFCAACQPDVTLRWRSTSKGVEYVNIHRFTRGGWKRTSEPYVCYDAARLNLIRDKTQWLRDYALSKTGRMA